MNPTPLFRDPKLENHWPTSYWGCKSPHGVCELGWYLSRCQKPHLTGKRLIIKLVNPVCSGDTTSTLSIQYCWDQTGPQGHTYLCPGPEIHELFPGKKVENLFHVRNGKERKFSPDPYHIVPLSYVEIPMWLFLHLIPFYISMSAPK